MIESVKKLTINKLAEYADARPSRRATIVRQQVKAQSYTAQYYILADSAIKRVLLSETPTKTFLAEANWIKSHPGWGDYPRSVVANNSLALKKMWDSLLQSGLIADEKVSFRRPSQALAPHIFGDVRVSSRFDLEIIKVHRGVRYGGVKFYVNKEHPLTGFSGSILSALLHEAASAAYGINQIDRKSVVILDVFHGGIFAVPYSTKKLIIEASAAALEFALHWDKLEGLG
jgi:hypothetical protein